MIYPRLTYLRTLLCIVTAVTAGIASIGISLYIPVAYSNEVSKTDLQAEKINALTSAKIPCTNANLTIKLPEHNPYDQLPAGRMPYGDGSKYKFTLTPISDIDITNPDTWETISALRASKLTGHTLGQSLPSKLTTSPGVVTFNNVPAGVYKVHAQAPVTTSNENPNIAEFITTVPVVDKANQQWLCSGTIYAKEVPTISYKPPTPPMKPPVPKNPLPNTGAALIGIFGITIIIAGIGAALIISSRKHRDTNTSIQGEGQ